MSDWHGRISPGFVRAMGTLTKKAIRVYCAYSFYAGPNHIASGVGQEKIAEFIGWSASATREVRRGLDELREAGLVSTHSGGFNEPLVVILRGWDDEAPGQTPPRRHRGRRDPACTGVDATPTTSSFPTGGQLTERVTEPVSGGAKVKSEDGDAACIDNKRLRRDRPIVVERQYGAFNGRAGRRKLPPECYSDTDVLERYGAGAQVREVAHHGQITTHVVKDADGREVDRYRYDWTGER